jgi:hypothetical protein|tara:strand:- start:91 stop:450 length:360 start_codon:yes stop_codon:yes gene_type:complete
MANPNIVNVANIYGKTAGLVVTTSATAIVTNASSSGKVFKINSLTIANVDGLSTALITCNLSLNGSSFKLANTITVPADASLILIGKDNPIYLEENSSIQLTASVNGDLEAVCSYEEIS